MSRIIVERTFQTPVTQEQLVSVSQRLSSCLDLYGVEWVRSLISPDRRRMLCEYEASDAESVRAVQNEADAHYDRVWPAEVIEARRS